MHDECMVQNNSSFSPDTPRLIRDTVHKGTIEQVSDGKVRVRTGDLLTDWLPWQNLRAGNVKISSTPSVGEQCLIISEGGNLNTGIVQPGINSNTNPMPTECGPDDFIVDIPPGGRFLLRCGSSIIEVNQNGITITGPRIDFNKV